MQSSIDVNVAVLFTTAQVVGEDIWRCAVSDVEASIFSSATRSRIRDLHLLEERPNLTYVRLFWFKLLSSPSLDAARTALWYTYFPMLATESSAFACWLLHDPAHVMVCCLRQADKCYFRQRTLSGLDHSSSRRMPQRSVQRSEKID